jgi:FkbM family methyltransferase
MATEDLEGAALPASTAVERRSEPTRVVPDKLPLRVPAKLTTLPNGMPFACRSRIEAGVCYGEIFRDEVYLQHGITLWERMTVFDVGANMGMFSLFVASRVPTARVHAFEPIPQNYMLLQMNLALHQLHHVHAVPFGLGSRAERALFTYYPMSVGWSTRHPHDTPDQRELLVKSLLSSPEAPFYARWLFNLPLVGRALASRIVDAELTGEQVACAVHTFSQMKRLFGVETVDLLKVDVERAELEVLEGIEPGDWPSIRQIVCEVQTDQTPDLRDRITALLRGHGFTVVCEEAPYMKDETGHSKNATLYGTRPG